MAHSLPGSGGTQGQLVNVQPSEGRWHGGGDRERGGDALKYSPDLNPIELPYSKFKALLRKVAARTVPALFKTIRSFVTAGCSRMRQLLQACGLCFRMTGIRFQVATSRVSSSPLSLFRGRARPTCCREPN
jgi:hypothetical protein